MDMKRFFLYFITIAALALAGCGGGGGGGTNLTVGDAQATQDLIDALESDRDTAQGERDTAQGERDTAQGERDTAQGERDMANMDLAAARTALGLADDADSAAILAAIMALGTSTSEDPVLATLRTALGLADDADRAAILAAVQGLGPDPGLAMDLADVRTALGVPDDADGAAILAAITALGTATSEDPALATLRTVLGLADDADRAAILAAVQTLDMDAMRDAGDLAAVRTALGVDPAADEAAILAAITALGTATSEDPVFATLRSALGLGADATRGAILDEVLALVAGDTRMEDPRAKKIAPAIADPDGDGVLGENDASERGILTDSDTVVAATADDLENPNRPGKGVEDDGSTDDFAAMPGGIGVMEEISIGRGDARDRLGMMDGTVDDENEFDIMADGTVDGFARNVHTRTNAADQSDKVTVFDNRDDPGDVPYREYYNDAQTDNDGDVVFDDAATLTTDPYDRDAVTAISEEGVLTIDTGATGDIAGNGKLFSATDFPSGDRVRYEYAIDDPDTEDVDEGEARTFAGRFNGIPGEYSCAAAALECSARNGMDGYLDLLIGAWTFTPDRVAKDADPHKIADAKFDADYLAFGYWLQGTGEGEKVTYGIGTFASGSMPFGDNAPTAALALLVGKATYSGPAAGMFVMKTDINDDNMGPLPTEAGKFTAEAELTAKFGSTTATADDFTISGTVTAFEFENHDGRTFENKWSLPLNRATFATRTYDQNTGVINPTSFSAQANTFGGTTGAGDNLGRWEGGFYGPVVTEVEETAVEEAKTGYPTGVAGEFIGHFDGSDGGEVGHVIGAFGAPIDP